MNSAHHLFDILIALHITTGAPGLIAFWLPVVTKKGSQLHKVSGRAFTVMMLLTASFAVAMATLTISHPIKTHPQLMEIDAFSDPVLIRGIFGWMMLYLGILTINLAWYGWVTVRHKTEHEKMRGPINLALQGLLTVASLNCAVQGMLIQQPMMIGISMVGFATVATNMWFILNRSPKPIDWLLEHIKALVGTGISVYTAFFAFGAVRLMPQLALAPILWAIPLIIGLTLIIYHQRTVIDRSAFRRPSRSTA